MSAAAIADQWLNGVPLNTSSILFFLGGNQPALSEALSKRGWRGRVVHLAPPAFGGLDAVAPSLEPDAEKPVLVLEPGVVRLHSDVVKQTARAIGKAWFGARANQEARRQNAGRYLLNTLRNLDAIAAEGDVRALVDAFARVPAIVVAAGPSLDQNLPDIRRYRDKALIIAVDTALRPLLAGGVHPDLVVAVDPTEANARHLVELPECASTSLVAEGSIDPEAMRTFAGRTFVCAVADHHPWPWLRTAGIERGRLRAWGSVLTTAFDLALTMGCEPVVFAGADLAFTNGRPYATGTTYDEDWRRFEAWGKRLEEVWTSQIAQWPDIQEAGATGQRVRTAPHLRSFRDWILAAASASGRQTINATTGGILSGAGIVQRSLDDVFGPLAPLERGATAASIGQCYRRSANGDAAAPSLPESNVRQAWTAFASVADTQIDAARAVLKAQSAGHRPAAAPPPEQSPEQRDACHIDLLSQTLVLTIVTVTNPSVDLLGQLRSASAALAAGAAVVVVDQQFTSVGAQVRQAIDALLVERRDLWVEHRRFIDRQSRISVIRSRADYEQPQRADADAAKWLAGHRLTADNLSGTIHGILRPGSVIDVGCGAGFWLDAFRTLGVREVHGVSSRDQRFLDTTDSRRFDLCLCVEVAHGVPDEEQDALVERCVRASDTVVFSSRPPGAQSAPSFERPLHEWAEKFWQHGYVMEDDLRSRLEHHLDFPRNVFDLLVVFRRRFEPAQVSDASLRAWILGSAARLYELQMQRAWWLMHAYDLRGDLGRQEAPQSPMTDWTIPASRLMSWPDGRRVFRFRSDAARWYLSHHGAGLQVCEDDVVVRGWERSRDELVLSSSDGTDPRVNGRRYSLCLPVHVALAEAQPPGSPG